MKRVVLPLLLLTTCAAAVLYSGCDAQSPDDFEGSSSEANLRVVQTPEDARAAFLEYEAIAERDEKKINKEYDEILAETALEAPGYAGHYFDEDGELVVALTATGNLQAATAALQGQVNAEALAPVLQEKLGGAREKRVEYDFLQLFNWRMAMRSAFKEIEEMTRLGIDEANNVITVGVSDLGAEASVREFTGRLGIPAEAVEVVEKQRPVSLRRIRRTRDTMGGGLRIQYVAHGTTWECTLGPMVYAIDGTVDRGFLVNSHCTEDRFQNDSEKFYQATRSGNYIAQEILDPPIRYTGSGTSCAGGCVYADAALTRWTACCGTKYFRGTVYRTEYRGRYSGSTTRSSSQKFSVNAEGTPTLNAEVNKVGARTGWTYGRITDTCTDFPLISDPSSPNPPPGVVHPCQIATDLGAGEGDSGSPVFSWPNQSSHYVAIQGILFARDASGEVIFSPVNQIENHFGKNFIFQEF